MSIVLVVAILIISVVLSFIFVSRDAKRFASAPPTPLVDMDRMYDSIYSKLDEVSGSAMTPQDLAMLLDSFIRCLGSHDLIHENLDADGGSSEAETLSNEKVVQEILVKNGDIDVPESVVASVVELSFAYLRDINAVV